MIGSLWLNGMALIAGVVIGLCLLALLALTAVGMVLEAGVFLGRVDRQKLTSSDVSYYYAGLELHAALAVYVLGRSGWIVTAGVLIPVAVGWTARLFGLGT